MWKPIVGFEGIYKVSHTGRVRVLDRVVDIGRGRDPFVRPGRVVHDQPAPRRSVPYRVVHLYKDGKHHLRYVHRLVLEAHVGPCPPGMECRHFPDRDPANNHRNNLSWGTRQENVDDQAVHGTRPLGAGRGHAKLTDDAVVEIRRLRALGVTRKDIAAHYKVSPSLICDGSRWRHVQLESR